MSHIPEGLLPIEAITPQVGAAITGDYVDLANADEVFVVVHIAQGNAATVAITIEQATVAAGTDSKAITNTVPIWSNLDCAASDTLVRRTDAVSYTTDAGVKHKLVIFQVKAASLDRANGFRYVTVKTGASHADNLTSALYILGGRRYQGLPANQPSNID